MGNFFMPWRRKIGVVSLLMTAAVVILWVRSPTHFDSISFTLWNEHHRVSSSSGYGIAWETWIWDEGTPVSIRDGIYPHAMIVLILAALSFVLLVSKPRSAKPTPRPTQIHNSTGLPK